MTAASDTDRRIAEWTISCTMHAGDLTPTQRFEAALRDQAAAGYYLPLAVIAGVRENLGEIEYV